LPRSLRGNLPSSDDCHARLAATFPLQAPATLVSRRRPVGGANASARLPALAGGQPPTPPARERNLASRNTPRPPPPRNQDLASRNTPRPSSPRKRALDRGLLGPDVVRFPAAPYLTRPRRTSSFLGLSR